MIQERSILKVADNSGAKTVRCFRVLGGSRKRYARIGEVIIASVQVAEPRKQVAKKDIVRCVVVRTTHPLRRTDGSVVRFDENAVVLINEKREPRGSRVFGPIPREVRERGFEGIFTMAEEVV